MLQWAVTARHEFRSDSSAKDLLFIFLANGDGMERISILLDFGFLSIHILSPILNTFTIIQYGPNSHLDVLGFV